MKRFLLDTHTFIWFLTEDKKLNNDIAESIVYYQNQYFVSVSALHEIVTKQTVKKLDLSINIVKISKIAEKYNIDILPIKIAHLETMSDLSVPVINGKQHLDPFDRIMIAQAICEKLTFISADRKFPYYKDKNFKLLQY
ncbi:MAG: type II toxin-antitoxin system VapC family toxin [Prevotellaceae bacterium]|jgi:PIN domain nuclease of toxin-antitoxin system|nr:type II toxin-antitoxin system VapC family toxin [Prevotellaceae bacterium]